MFEYEKKEMRNMARVAQKCPDCGPLQTPHLQKWLQDLVCFTAPLYRPTKIHHAIGFVIDHILLFLHVLYLGSDMEDSDISLRTKVFSREAAARGIEILPLRSRYGYINHFIARKGGKKVCFEGLPLIEGAEGNKHHVVDDKARVKKILAKHHVPVAQGKAFWWWQLRSAIHFGEHAITYPLVIKPRLGSMSQHITVGIENRKDFITAIKKTTRYCPSFLIEKYLPNTHTYRATVVGETFVACVKRIPAHVDGDGVSTIKELIDIKNSDIRRGIAGQKEYTTFKIITDAASNKLLDQAGYTYEAIPQKDERVFLQEKVILDIGADLEEVTESMHQDNRELFCRTASLFGTKLIGIDFLAGDITISWKDQACAILELNTLPYIDMHHYPTRGSPVNVGAEVAAMMDAYYFS